MVHVTWDYVATTGDGVNDTCAQRRRHRCGDGKRQCCGARGSFVLLANDFAVFPSVVAEGRRSSVERAANLFLTKTFYALALALAVGVAGLPFPSSRAISRSSPP
jgi:cation-transporting ATPase E